MLKREVLMFVMTGLCGLALDAGGVFVLSHFFSLEPIYARIPAFALAILATFFLNRYFTFSHARNTLLIKSFAKYISANAVSQGLNFFIYAGLVGTNYFFYQQPVFAVLIGSALAAMLSFIMFKYMVFHAHH